MFQKYRCHKSYSIFTVFIDRSLNPIFCNTDDLITYVLILRVRKIAEPIICFALYIVARLRLFCPEPKTTNYMLDKLIILIYVI